MSLTRTVLSTFAVICVQTRINCAHRVNGELKQGRRRRELERHLQTYLRVSAVIFSIIHVIILAISAPIILELKLELVFTRAAPAFDNLFMRCVFNINTVHKTVEKLTFQAFY